MNKYVIYTRVSTNKQGRSGLGLEAQLKAAHGYVDAMGGKVIETFSEVASGRKNDRIELASALRTCKLTGAVLVIAKLDRLSRSTSFTMALHESRVDFIACDMPSANKLTIGFMAHIAEHEAQVISERTKAAMQAAKERGVKLGNPNLHLVANRDLTKANKVRVAAKDAYYKDLSEVIQEFETEFGTMTTRQMADKLNDAGVISPRGAKISNTHVCRAKAA